MSCETVLSGVKTRIDLGGLTVTRYASIAISRFGCPREAEEAEIRPTDRVDPSLGNVWGQT